MPEANQYTFTHKELLEVLIKKAGVHDGKWVIAVNFGFSATNIGPAPDQLSPGAVVAVLNMVIQRAGPDTHPEMFMDAAMVNPKKD